MSTQLEQSGDRANTIFNQSGISVALQDDQFLAAWVYGKSKHTQEAYLRIARDLLGLVTPCQLKDVGLPTLQAFIELIRGTESKRLRSAVVRSLYSFGVRIGYLPANTAAFLPQIKSESRLSQRYLTEEEVLRLILSAQTPRDRAILKVLYSGGLRVAELSSLNWGDTSPRDAGGQLTFKGKGNKIRTVILSEGVFTGLMKIKPPLARDTDPIFLSRESKRLHVASIQKMIRQAALRAGITKRVSPHWLRHAHASHALDRGAPIHLVQATLGHASVATTGKYLHARPNESSSKYLPL